MSKNAARIYPNRMRNTRSSSRLPPAVVAGIQRRLALTAAGILGHGLRAIRRDTSVNRDTIRAIAREEYEAEPPSFQRCNGCGHCVLLPCLICVARLARAAVNSPRPKVVG